MVRVYKEISIYQIRVSFETLFNVTLSLCYGDFFFPLLALVDVGILNNVNLC